MDVDARDIPLVAVTDVRPLDDYRIELWFANGRHGMYDMTGYLDKGVFRTLRDQDVFRRVHVALGTATWPGDINVACERLWTDCAPIEFGHTTSEA